MAPTVSVVIPAFNEEQTIGDVVAMLKRNPRLHEIIVVSDGSVDATAEKARAAGARVFEHPYNIGNGAAVKKGFRQATGDLVLMMDADGQHPTAAVDRLIDRAGAYDMVIAARTAASDVSRFRAFGNWILIRVAQYLSGHRIQDLTSGFRIIDRKKLMEFIPLLPNRYSYPSTITLCFLCSGYSVGFEPIAGITRRQAGISNINPLRDGVRFMFIIFRIIMLFEPMKFFIPVSLLLLAGGAGFSVYTVMIGKGIEDSGIILIISGLLILFFGLLTDQVAHLRRERLNG